jgi:hypothetical protein
LNIEESQTRPFFGKMQRLNETIHSLDEKWYVEFWDVHYYFLGIEVFSTKKEVVRTINGSKVGRTSVPKE